jgi:hypothetical protein
MATSKIRARAIRFSGSERKNTGTTFAYIGLNFTVPANCVYTVTAELQYNNGAPRAIGIGTGTSNQYSMYARTDTTSGVCIATASGYTGSSARTFYLWTQQASSGSNTVTWTGFYIPVGA